jgi:hypothetical protein
VSHLQRIIAWSNLILICAPGRAADLQEIVRRGTDVINSDWAADVDYAYVERDETQKDGKRISKTYRVITIDGSDYNVPIAVDDQPLSPDREKLELEKLKDEIQRRNGETPSARRQRIEKFKKQRDENGALLLEFPKTFTFELLREETAGGYPAYVLSAIPKKRTGPMSRAVKVLTGMHGTLWIEKDTFHTIRGECAVLNPVPVYGILARVLPGTHIELDLAPVTESIWLIHSLTMELKISKLFLFSSAQVTRSTFSDYQPNSTVVDELVSKANQSGLK